MLRITSEIAIGGNVYPHFNSVRAESSWQMLTDACELLLPRKVRIDKTPINKVIKVRDAVTVDLGYDGKNDRVFTGVVARGVNPTFPLKVMCEDGMFLLKANRVTHQWANATLKDIVEHVAPGVEHKLLDVQIGKYTIPEDWNSAKVFDDLKSSYGLQTFFRDGKLQVGLQYDSAYAKTKTFDFEGNIIEHGLEFITKDDIRLKVKAISIAPNNVQTSVELGDLQASEERTLHFYDLSDTELKAAAERELERLRYTGYRGSFTTFGKPFVRHGDIVKLIDRTYDRGGSYWVDKVERDCTVDGGYRQVIHLGPTA